MSDLELTQCIIYCGSYFSISPQLTRTTNYCEQCSCIRTTTPVNLWAVFLFSYSHYRTDFIRLQNRNRNRLDSFFRWWRRYGTTTVSIHWRRPPINGLSSGWANHTCLSPWCQLLVDGIVPNECGVECDGCVCVGVCVCMYRPIQHRIIELLLYQTAASKIWSGRAFFQWQTCCVKQQHFPTGFQFRRWAHCRRPESHPLNSTPLKPLRANYTNQSNTFHDRRVDWFVTNGVILPTTLRGPTSFQRTTRGLFRIPRSPKQKRTMRHTTTTTNNNNNIDRQSLQRNVCRCVLHVWKLVANAWVLPCDVLSLQWTQHKTIQHNTAGTCTDHSTGVGHPVDGLLSGVRCAMLCCDDVGGTYHHTSVYNLWGFFMSRNRRGWCYVCWRSIHMCWSCIHPTGIALPRRYPW